MSAIIVREFAYTLEDAHHIKQIDACTFGDCKYNHEEIIQVAMDDRYKLYVAEMEGKPVGYMGLLRVNTLHYRGLWVDLIAVSPEHQGMGIGGQLLEQAKKLGAAYGVDMMSGLVATNNVASQSIFHKHGFEPVNKDYHLFLLEYSENPPEKE